MQLEFSNRMQRVCGAAVVLLVLLIPYISTQAGTISIGVDQSLTMSSGPGWFADGKCGVVDPAWWWDRPEVYESSIVDGDLYADVQILAGTDYRAQCPQQVGTKEVSLGTEVYDAVAGPAGDGAYAVFSYAISVSLDYGYSPPDGGCIELWCKTSAKFHDVETSSVASTPKTPLSDYPSVAEPRSATWVSEDGLIIGIDQPTWVRAGHSYWYSFGIKAGLCEYNDLAIASGHAKARLSVHWVRVDFVDDTENLPPIAVASANNDGTQRVGDVYLDGATSKAIWLDGSSSRDPEGAPLNYSWTLVEKPPSSVASIDDPGSVSPLLLVDQSGTYRVSLIVNDGVLDSTPDEVVVTVLLADDIPDWRKHARRGDLVFYRSAGRWNPLKILGLYYTHVGVYLGDGFVAESHKDTGGISDSRGLDFWDSQEAGAVVRIAGASREQIESLIGFILSREGPYQFAYTAPDSDGPDWYCSEAVVCGIADADIPIDIDLSKAVSPDQLFNEPGFDIVGLYIDEVTPGSGIAFQALCPVFLSVETPDGLSAGPSELEVPDSAYAEFDLDLDGAGDSAVAIPPEQITEGQYLITISPTPDALPTDTYTIEVADRGQVVVLAESVPISDIPDSPYEYTPIASPTPAVFRVSSEGDVYSDSTVHAASFEADSADVAEWVTVSDQVEAGDVLALDLDQPRSYCRTSTACSLEIAGVVSSKPGLTLGGTCASDTRALLALVGIVPVKVTNEGGPIQLGDLLVSSSTPGHAMRWAEPEPCPFSLVGKALEPMTEESGVILVLLTAH